MVVPKDGNTKYMKPTHCETTLELTRVSPDGDENFPGNLTAKVLFKLTDDNAIDIKYSATTDKKTVINMTNHSYFNLSGDPSKAATDHILYVNADSYTPVDRTYMTTGRNSAGERYSHGFYYSQSSRPGYYQF